jgi:formyltetrahydrofolate deformylase
MSRQEDDSSNWVLLVACPDRPGIVAAVAKFVADHGGNIVTAEQHTDETTKTFHQRVEFSSPIRDLAQVKRSFAQLAAEFDMDFSFHESGWQPRTAILASRQTHCLTDLLARAFTGELPIEVVAVISDYPDCADFVRRLGYRFVHLPIDSNRETQEAELSRLLDDLHLDLVVLARYMRVLPPEIVRSWRNRMINIHHSFLPAFVGADPYRQAHERGVKVIGATAHYVTEELDAGPIIEQDVVHVSHRDGPEVLARRGRDLETLVLSRAVRAHVEHRLQVTGNHTIVFS